MFCLPWYLTWFSHNLNRYSDVVRLYDYFLASPKLLPIYLISVIVLHREEDILQTSCEMPSVHCLLSQVINLKGRNLKVSYKLIITKFFVRNIPTTMHTSCRPGPFQIPKKLGK